MTQDEAKVSWKGGLAAIAVGFVLLLIVAEILLRLFFPHWRDFYSGWFMQATEVNPGVVVATGVPGFDGYFAQNNGDFRVHIKINDFGLRDDEPVSAANGRTWVIGDSMTFGWGVERNEMYSSLIAEMSGKPTYNVASPGTDVCGYQKLYKRMPDTVKPSAIVVGLILENDLRMYDCPEELKPRPDHNATATGDGPWSFITVKRFLTHYLATYNFFTVAVKRVNVLTELLKMVGLVEKDHTYKLEFDQQNTSAVVDSTVQALLELRAMAPQDIPFVVLIAPSRFELRDNDPVYHKVRQDIGAALRAQGVLVADPYDGFAAQGLAPTHFAHDGHWSTLGHEIAAREVVKQLQAVH